MKIVKKTNEKLVFASKIGESLANAIRRTVGMIPIMAVDELEIERNDSPLYDETLAHRVGLVPLKMPKGAKEDSVEKLKLVSKRHGYVYSKDIKGDVEVVYGEIPLTLLAEEQEVKATCIAKVGKGIDHAKFMPGLFTYRVISEITLSKKHKDAIASAFPENSIKEKGDMITVKDDQEKTITDFCEGLCQRSKEECEVKDTKELMITIESFGQISAEEIFKQATKILKDELKALSKSF